MSDPTLPPPAPAPSSNLILLPSNPASSPTSKVKSSKSKREGSSTSSVSVTKEGALIPGSGGDSPQLRGKKKSIGAKDRDRWRKWKDGQSPEEIATHEKTSVLKVNNSIQKFLSYQSSVSHEAVDMKANEVVIGTLDELPSLLRELLAAVKDKVVKGEDGKEETIQVPDLKVRSTVVDKITQLIQSVRKTNGLNLNLSQNNQTNVAMIGGRTGRSFEARLREAEARHKQEARERGNEEDMVRGDDEDEIEGDIIEGELAEEAEVEEELPVDPDELDNPDTADEGDE